MHDNEVREMSIDVHHSEDYDPEHLTIGTAYIRDKEDAPNKYPLRLAGTVYRVPLTDYAATILNDMLEDADLPESVICDGGDLGFYIWVIGE